MENVELEAFVDLHPDCIICTNTGFPNLIVRAFKLLALSVPRTVLDTQKVIK